MPDFFIVVINTRMVQLSKNTQMMMAILVLLSLGGVLYMYLNKKASEEEGFTNMNSELMGNNRDQGGVKPSEGVGENEVFHEIKDKSQQQQMKRPENVPKDCFPKDQLSPGELLPKDANSTWAQVNPSGQGELRDQNFLNAGYHVGINTVGQTMRNPNLQIRSEPANPQVKVSPWLQSTIEPDSNRRPLEIGGCE